MLVKCIGNSPEHLRDERTKQAYARNIHQERVWLEIGQTYLVYGVAFRDGENIPWFLICEDEDDEYPKPHLSAFFEIVDGKIPCDWAFTTTPNNAGEISFLPKRWAKDPCFLEKLDDEEIGAVEYFRELKAGMNG